MRLQRFHSESAIYITSIKYNLIDRHIMHTHFDTVHIRTTSVPFKKFEGLTASRQWRRLINKRLEKLMVK